MPHWFYFRFIFITVIKMERRKASPEQLNMLLHFLEEDKELAIGKFTGLEGRIRQTNAWIKITEKLNANSGFGSGAIKTPDKWQQVLFY